MAAGISQTPLSHEEVKQNAGRVSDLFEGSFMETVLAVGKGEFKKKGRKGEMIDLHLHLDGSLDSDTILF